MQYWLQYEWMGVAEPKVNLIQIVKVALKWKLFFNSMRKLMEIISINLIKTDWKVFIPWVIAPGHDWYLLSEGTPMNTLNTAPHIYRYLRFDAAPKILSRLDGWLSSTALNPEHWATLAMKTVNFPTCPNSVKSLTTWPDVKISSLGFYPLLVWQCIHCSRWRQGRVKCQPAPGR